jgi:hypothetical protein
LAGPKGVLISQVLLHIATMSDVRFATQIILFIEEVFSLKKTVFVTKFIKENIPTLLRQKTKIKVLVFIAVTCVWIIMLR